MMVRLLAFTLNVSTSSEDGALELAKDLWNADEPALWEKDLAGQIKHWIEVGQPDERRLLQASSRCESVVTHRHGGNKITVSTVLFAESINLHFAK